jgi:hypothetical protein
VKKGDSGVKHFGFSNGEKVTPAQLSEVPSRDWLEFEGDVISSLFAQIGVGAPMEITP